MGAWRALGLTRGLEGADLLQGNLPLVQLEFDQERNVTATLSSGETDSTHQWFRKNQYIWLRWHGRVDKRPGRAEIPLEFRGRRIYLAWPPGERPEGYLVFERIGE